MIEALFLTAFVLPMRFPILFFQAFRYLSPSLPISLVYRHHVHTAAMHRIIPSPCLRCKWPDNIQLIVNIH
jgi:hypothetical protein